MKLLSGFLSVTTAFLSSAAGAGAQEVSAGGLAERLAEKQGGTAVIRLRMEIQKPPGSSGEVLQLHVKQRRGTSAAEVVYQILWPTERKGEAVLVGKSASGRASGVHITPSGQIRQLKPPDMDEPMFGSDLVYSDVVENPYAWKRQEIVGKETIEGTSTVILESRPGSGEHSQYASVRSWIDPRRDVPLRIEKRSGSGKVITRVEVSRVSRDSRGESIPSKLTIQRAGNNSLTKISGSRMNRGVSFSDKEFTPEGIADLSSKNAD